MKDYQAVMTDDDYEQLPSTRIEYALDAIGCHRWRSYHDETKAKLIQENCHGNILDWGEPIRDEQTTTYDANGNTTGCRGITCSECWEHEAYKEASNDAR